MRLDELLVTRHQTMGRPLDRDLARKTLEQEYDSAENAFRKRTKIKVPKTIADATARLFSSKTQAYREALIGCAIARILDPEIDIRLPYMKQGERAFHGRDLDEKVVNPFLRDHAIPCSTGPYLSSIRRNVSFIPETLGQKDRQAYEMMLAFINELLSANEKNSRLFLRYLLRAFIQLREASDIKLADIRKLSVEQYEKLINGLLTVASGGWLPMLLAVGTFKTISDCFDLGWRVDWKGINVADRAKGEGGDINVFRNDRLMFSVEVTEREITRSRVVTTFKTKISPAGIDDYIFFFTATLPTPDAREAARQYFAQGHDINLIPVKDWILTILSTIGPRCRRIFTERFMELLGTKGVPAALKVAWNDQLDRLLAG
jgi:hypothetical protein